MSASVRIGAMTAEHAVEVLAIYQAGIDEGDATFETSAPTWESYAAAKLPEHRLVALDENNGAVLGWAAVVAVSDRCVYSGVVEHSVYVHPAARGRGVGSALLNTLIDSTERAGIWTVQSGIFPENTAVRELNKTMGVREVGVYEKHGQLDGDWRDVVIVERLIPANMR